MPDARDAEDSRRNKKDMKIKKLAVEEKGRTRALWEEVFSEDTREFLDYYYFIKTRDNDIYVIEDEENVPEKENGDEAEIVSMIQLNPYPLQIADRQEMTHYIIGVATRESCRKRGYMRELLVRTMEEMYRKKEPFTFLMPAAKEIYLPYDFRFIYEQDQSELCGGMTANAGKAGNPSVLEVQTKSDKYRIRDARWSDAEDLAAFFTECTGERYRVYAVRDTAYYQNMILEQQSENGGILLAYEGEKLVAIAAYANEGEWEIREPLTLPGYEECVREMIRELTKDEETSCLVYPWREGGQAKKVPMIMARALHLSTLLSCLQAKEAEEVDCAFAVIDPILQQNSRVYRLKSPAGEETTEVTETEDSFAVLPVDVLTELIFGVKNPTELALEQETIQGMVLTDRFIEEWKKLIPLAPVFLNEIV